MSNHMVGMEQGDEFFRILENGDILKDERIINGDVNALAECMLALARVHVQHVEEIGREPDWGSQPA